MEAIEAWFRERIGIDWYELNLDRGVGTPFVHASLDFRSPVTPRDTLATTVLLARLGGSSLRFAVAGARGDEVGLRGRRWSAPSSTLRRCGRSARRRASARRWDAKPRSAPPRPRRPAASSAQRLQHPPRDRHAVHLARPLVDAHHPHLLRHELQAAAPWSCPWRRSAAWRGRSPPAPSRWRRP